MLCSIVIHALSNILNYLHPASKKCKFGSNEIPAEIHSLAISHCGYTVRTSYKHAGPDSQEKFCCKSNG